MADRARVVVLTRPGAFEITEVPVPNPGDDGAVLRLEACGLCGTDVEVFRGELREAVYPTVPGHEPLGVVDRIGAGARRRWGVGEGDRVVVKSSLACGRCRGCASGGGCVELGVGRLANYGFIAPDLEPRLWGGFATHLYLPPQARTWPLSADVPVAEASLFNALANGLHWVAAAGVRPGHRVVVLGPGPRGLACVVAAARAGAERIVVTGLERDVVNLDLAQVLGADTTMVVEPDGATAALLDALPGGADAVIDTTPGAPQSVVDAVHVARRGGTVVLAGLKGPRPFANLFADDISTKELTIRGVGSTPFGAMVDAVRIIESRRFPLQRLATHAYALEQAETALLSLASAEGAARPVHAHLSMA